VCVCSAEERNSYRFGTIVGEFMMTEFLFLDKLPL